MPVFTLRAATGVAVAALVLLGAVGFASAQGGQTGTPVSTCDNPVLNNDLAGWGVISGSAPFRYPLAGTSGPHTSATAAYVQANNPQPDPRAWMPQMPVRPGQQWTFAVDARTDVPGQGRMLVDWYTASNAYLGQTAGVSVPLPATAPTTWYRMAGEFTAPTGATRANVLADADLPAGADFSLTACEYKPTTQTDPPPTTEPPATTDPPATTEPPATTDPPGTSDPPPPGDEDTAAERFGWGTPLPASDEFSYTGQPDPARWTLPPAECWPGHAGNGRRCPENTTVDGSKLVMVGEAGGDSGWVTSDYGHRYGRVEARVRSFNTGPSGNPYHPLLITWADTVPYPSGGEYDWLENGAPGMACAEAFLHLPGHTPYRQEHAVETNCGAPLSEWHNIAFSWSPEALVGFVDGREWFRFSAHDITAMPEGSLKIQLDNFFGAGMRPAQYEVDWVRFYPAS